MTAMPPGAFCPLIRDECVGPRCKFWLVEELTNTQTGERKLVHDCLLVHQYHLSRQAVVEQIRQIATTDKVAASLDRTGGTLVRAVATAARARTLQGGDHGGDR